MNKMDARRKQILFLIYMFGLLILYFVFSKISVKAGGYVLVLSLVLVCFFLPFFAFLPIAIEKPLRARLSKGQTRNANGLWRVVFGYTLFCSILLCICMFMFVPSFIKNVLQLPSVAFCIPFLVPALVFLALCRALCMYFQGKGSGLQTVIASVLLIGFSLLFAYVVGTPLADYGQKVADLMRNQEFLEQYLMMGVTIGISIASVITFLFLLFAFFLSARENRRNKNTIRLTEHKVDSIRIFVGSFFPYWFAALMMLIPALLSFVLFFESHTNRIEALEALGALAKQQYIPCAISLLFMLSFVVLIVAQISNCIKREEIRQARDGFRIGLVWILIVGGFIAASQMAVGSWKSGFLFFVTTMSYFFFTLLWQGGKRKGALVSMFASMVASMTVSFLLSGMLKEAEYIIFIPLATQLGVLACLSGFFLIKHYRFMPEWLQGFLFPIFSSVIAGFVMYVIGRILENSANNIILSILVLVVGAFVHLVICMVLQCGNDNDMLNLPGGKLWVYIGNRLRLFR